MFHLASLPCKLCRGQLELHFCCLSGSGRACPLKLLLNLLQPGLNSGEAEGCELRLLPNLPQTTLEPKRLSPNLSSFLPSVLLHLESDPYYTWQLCQPCLPTFSHGHLILPWHLIVGGPRKTQSEKVKKERYRKVISGCFTSSFLLEISQLIRKKSIFFHLRTLYAASLILSKLISTFKTNNEAQEDTLLPCKAI